MKKINPTDKFSAERFRALLGIGIHSREARMCLSGVAVVMIVTLVISLLDGFSGGSAKPYYDTLDTLRGFSVLSIGFICSFGASVFAASLSRKENRVSSIMLPATRLEKFLARVVVSFVGSVAAYLVAYLVVFGVLAALSMVTGEPAQIGTDADYSPFEMLNMFTVTVGGRNVITPTLRLLLIANFVTFAVCGPSIYLLGGVVWNGRSWIFTSVVLIVIGSILGAMGIYYMGVKFSGYDASFTSLLVVQIIVTAAVAAVCIALSYRLFARMQAVKPSLRKTIRRAIKG